MGLPKLKEYAAQLRHIICCMPDYTVKWNDMEKEFGEHPIQSYWRRRQYKKIKNCMDPITEFTLMVKLLKKHRIKKEMKVIRWVAYDSDFKPAIYDK